MLYLTLSYNNIKSLSYLPGGLTYKVLLRDRDECVKALVKAEDKVAGG